MPTGRKAVKRIASRAGEKLDELIEVTPFGDDVPTWKRWVRTADLFEVQNIS